MRVTVISTGFRAPTKAICLASVAAQRGVDVEHIYIEASEQNPPRTVTENQREAIAKLPADRVVACVDGDDWLADRHVLMHVAALHRAGAWVTYGQYVTSEGKMGHCAEYPLADYRNQPWLASHLKTFRAGLYNRIRPADLDGVRGAHDHFMLALMEMAGPDRVRFVRDVLYVYNIDNALERTASPEQMLIERSEAARICRMRPYAQVGSL